jgi:microcystin-dependent protein
MSILIVRRGIQGPRGLSGLASRETLQVAANIEAIKLVAENIDGILAAPVEAENILYDHNESGRTAINAQEAIDELVVAINANTAALAIANLIAPVGTVLDYAGVTAPENYLMCYGQTLDSVANPDYAPLFNVIGTIYGGTGADAFKVPDKRGRTSAGKDDMGGTSADRLTNQTGGINGDGLGQVGGAETHTLTSPQMPSHTHASTFTMRGNSANVYGTFCQGDGGDHGSYTVTSASTGSNGAHNNVQPTIIFNSIIRYK